MIYCVEKTEFLGDFSIPVKYSSPDSLFALFIFIRQNACGVDPKNVRARCLTSRDKNGRTRGEPAGSQMRAYIVRPRDQFFFFFVVGVVWSRPSRRTARAGLFCSIVVAGVIAYSYATLT